MDPESFVPYEASHVGDRWERQTTSPVQHACRTRTVPLPSLHQPWRRDWLCPRVRASYRLQRYGGGYTVPSSIWMICSLTIQLWGCPHGYGNPHMFSTWGVETGTRPGWIWPVVMREKWGTLLSDQWQPRRFDPRNSVKAGGKLEQNSSRTYLDIPIEILTYMMVVASFYGSDKFSGFIIQGSL